MQGYGIAKRARRYHGTIAYNEDDTGRLKDPLHNGAKLEGVKLYGSGTLDVTVDGSAVVQDGFLKLLKRIRFITTRGTYVNVTAQMLFYFLKFMRGVEPYKLAVSGFTTGQYAFYVELTLPFAMLRSVAPRASFFDAPAHGNIQVEVDWGNPSNLVTGGTKSLDTGSAVEPTVAVTPMYNKWPDPPTHRTYLKCSQYDITGEDTEFKIRLQDSAVGRIVRRALLMTTDNGVRDNDILTKLHVERGDGDIGDKVLWKRLRQENKELYQIETLDDGLAVLDFDEDGTFANILEPGEQTLHVVGEVGSPTAPSNVQVLVESVDLTTTGALEVARAAGVS